MSKDYDLDGDAVKDTLKVYAAESGEGYDTGLLSFFVNEKEAGTFDCTKYELYAEDFELVETKDKDAFLIVGASQGDDYSTFLLFSYKDGLFSCCLNGEDVVQAKQYLRTSNSIRFQKGAGGATDGFVVNSYMESQSLGYHQTIIRYLAKYHCVYKYSRVYQTKLTSSSKILTVARKTPAYEKASTGKRAFYFEKGDKVKVSKLYDNPKRFRIYIRRISDRKAGWVNGIPNYTTKTLFVGVELDYE